MISCTVGMDALYTHPYNSVNTHAFNTLLHSDDMSARDTIRELVERRKEKTGQSLTAQAREMLMTQATLYRIISGDIQHPSYDKLKVIAKFYGCSVEDLESGAALALEAPAGEKSDKAPPENEPPSCESVNYDTVVSPSSNSHAREPVTEYASPAITYEVIRDVVAGALRGLGVSYEALVNDEPAARQRIEEMLRTDSAETPAPQSLRMPAGSKLIKSRGGMISDRRSGDRRKKETR